MPTPFDIGRSASGARRSPLLKSYTFWSGLLTLVFLLGAWNDSRYHRHYIRVAGAGMAWLIGQAGGRVYIFHLQTTLTAPLTSGVHRGHRQPSFERNAYGPLPVPVVKFKRADSASGSVFAWYWSVAWWLVIPPYLALWSLLLYYRHRRIKKAAAFTPPD